ncbi:MAG: EAL domain-containing response regulator [Gammaproteobacteria bacterium]|nr:EAL domain-containing response regulator [Gammaproteobacteria bacterium]
MKQKRLLIVDDDPRIGRLMSRSLKGMDFVVRALHRPHELESVYREFRPNVILLDLQMPGIDSIEVLRQLAGWGCSASILIFSGMVNDAARAAERLGDRHGLKMEATLQKPLGIGEMRQRMEELLDTQGVAAAEDVPISEANLSQTIECDELVVHYQPKVACRSNKLIGVEALVRWRHPHYGLISPDRFIPLAEETGLIGRLTSRVLESAFRDVRQWLFR